MFSFDEDREQPAPRNMQMPLASFCTRERRTSSRKAFSEGSGSGGLDVIILSYVQVAYHFSVQRAHIRLRVAAVVDRQSWQDQYRDSAITAAELLAEVCVPPEQLEFPVDLN